MWYLSFICSSLELQRKKRKGFKLSSIVSCLNQQFIISPLVARRLPENKIIRIRIRINNQRILQLPLKKIALQPAIRVIENIYRDVCNDYTHQSPCLNSALDHIQFVICRVVSSTTPFFRVLCSDRQEEKKKEEELLMWLWLTRRNKVCNSKLE